MQISLISDVAENLNLSMHVISICVTEFIHDCKKQKEDRGLFANAVIFIQVTLVFTVLKL